MVRYRRIRISHPSGSRRLCFKPIGIKTRPLVLLDPRRSSVPCRVQLDGVQILWLLANPLRTHDIGESRSKTITSWLWIGAAGTNHIFWFNTNPSTGWLLHLNSYFIGHLSFGLWKMFSFNCFFCRTALKIFILDLAGCGSCQSSLVVNYQPLIRLTAAPKLINKITYFHQSQPDHAWCNMTPAQACCLGLWPLQLIWSSRLYSGKSFAP